MSDPYRDTCKECVAKSRHIQNLQEENDRIQLEIKTKRINKGKLYLSIAFLALLFIATATATVTTIAWSVLSLHSYQRIGWVCGSLLVGVAVCITSGVLFFKVQE